MSAFYRSLPPEEQAMADRLLAYLKDNDMQMPDEEFLALVKKLTS